VAAAGRSSDPVAISWTYIVATLHWLAVGDWAAVDAGLPRALEAGAGARLHRVVDQVVLLAGVCRYLPGRFEEAADARAVARDRRDPMAQLWGVLVLAEAGLRADPPDPALAGQEPSFHPYTIEAHAGIPEVCLALLEGGGASGADRPSCGDGRRRPAVRSWTGAVRAAERLAMPWELARGQLELGRHLAPGERGPGGRPAG
jgi:hypothetical protein